MHSSERYTASEQQQLLMLARKAVTEGIAGKQPEQPEVHDLPWSLQQQRACFVSLKIKGQLRGCIGNLEANSTLAEAVLRNSYLAAFSDQRFQPVSESELQQLSFEISVLTPLTELKVASELKLLEVLRPGIDGLVFEADGHRATFLPVVWEQLNNPVVFLNQLRQKAGLPMDYWSENVKCWIYQAIKIGESVDAES